ncbi:MAG: hypothetical protein ACRCXZ_07720, partial [Patescibacteria group bacterium]
MYTAEQIREALDTLINHPDNRKIIKDTITNFSSFKVLEADTNAVDFVCSLNLRVPTNAQVEQNLLASLVNDFGLFNARARLSVSVE